MADFDVDDKDIDTFHRDLDNLAKHFPKEARRLMMRSGNHARKIVLRKAKQSVVEDTGNYFKSIKRGKVWVKGKEYKVRTYSRSPHAHLLEYGHRMVGPEPDKKELGYVLGFNIFDKAGKEINHDWNKILDEELYKILKKL
ncbi:HK97 gp10 family phage protein [Brevibacillus sp. DP1.3A]|uniref:HK97 gp10 family phage protein n=1 Tax=Brevibacillus sp. DP1.3A TaxID=2738867 RepID=UPI00156A76AB|nr:HK97 gp10 family phage protein [Brevibacillus sp. DP1.3A]UED78049.1 HK97 gp10 family phage protein [Brevibacillus sp. DP1.3A]